MGRLMTVLGFLLLIGGIGGMVVSNVSSFNFGSLGSLGASPTTEQLCKAGETLVEEKGSYSIPRDRVMPARYSIFAKTPIKPSAAMSRVIS